MSCSFGKDSLATYLLALEHNEPLDEVVYVEVMFDNKRGISGANPEHIAFIYDTAIPFMQKNGTRVSVLRGEKDYVGEFFRLNKKRGMFYGFPLAGGCVINSDCKVGVINRYLKSLKTTANVVQYIGIASDEGARLAKMHQKPNHVSLLEKYNVTEGMAYAMVKDAGLLSPVYKSDKGRDGCWFCPNKNVRYFARLKREHPDLYKELKKLSDYQQGNKEVFVSLIFNRQYTFAQLDRLVEIENNKFL